MGKKSSLMFRSPYNLNMADKEDQLKSKSLQNDLRRDVNHLMEHESVDSAAFEGWDFDQLNATARELRAVERAEGRDTAVSRSSGEATGVVRHGT